jgi:pyrroline-5-carboxylate reductase
MGGALLEGWLRLGLDPKTVAVFEPQPASQISALGGRGLQINPNINSLTNVEAIVVAVKPQTAAAALPQLASMIGTATVVVSIMAGRTIRSIATALGRPCALVRAMPNTPAAIGRGISVAVADKPVTKAQRDLADTLLSACGEVAWVDDEDLINPVTALSGGGPAYVFLLMEAMAEAGRKAGLPADLAMRLARVTVSGAGELARLSGEPAAQLRQNVTSPKGTTLEALKILMADDGIQPLFDRAIAAATRRSRELAG